MRVGAASMAVGAVAVSMSGCMGSDTDPTDPITDRESAVEVADVAYETARSQGVDFERAPCIWDYGAEESDWVIVVDAKGGRPFADVARECPSFASGWAEHAVVLTREGEVVAAR